jgi:hypothetical protein
MRRTIVKVQRALMPPDATALIYDERRTHQELRHLTPAEAAEMRTINKAYWLARWDAHRETWSLLKRTDHQDW